jgi:uncharacterized lipoprotein YajG
MSSADCNSTRARTSALRRAALGAIALLAGCAATAAVGCSSAASPSTITLTYTQPAFLTPTQHAEGVGVRVVVQDERADKTKVGDVVAASGAAQAPITSTNSVTDVVHSALREGLETRGFNVGTGSVTMRIGIARFTTLYNSGLLGGASDTYVELNVQVVTADGKTIFQKSYTGRGQPAGMQMSSGRGAAEALDDALDQAVTTMLSDAGLTDALIAAAEAHRAPPQPSGSQQDAD